MTQQATHGPIRANIRVLTAALVGTSVEFYDFYIFGTAAALVFGPMFFPKADPVAQLIFVFMINGVAFAARPLGAMFFGHFGDRTGRKSTLVASLVLMGISTFAIALLPSYAGLERFGVGWLAPALLCLLRFGQGFAVGGEWGGAALLAVENAPKGWESRFGVAPQLGAPVGFFCSTGLFLILRLMRSFPTEEPRIAPPANEPDQAVTLLGGQRPLAAATGGASGGASGSEGAAP